MNGTLVIVSGPSGVGKDAIIDTWSAWNPRVKRVVACTTRSPRPGEVDGESYHFLSLDAFQAKAEAGEFLEWKSVHEHAYATPLSSVDKLLDEQKIAILKIDVQGALTVMEKRKDILSIFLMPPSLEELERRIRGRGTETEETVALRLRNAHEEMEQRWAYTYIAVNDQLEPCIQRIEDFVAAAEGREPVKGVA